MKKVLQIVVLGLVLSVAIGGALARDCYVEECAFEERNCFTTFAQWCDDSSVNCFNHTRYSQAVNASWDAWNNPPAYSTSLSLYTDGIDNPYHDIDYWEVNRPDQWWWGLFGTDTPPVGGCFVRGSGYVYANVPKINDAYWKQLRTMEHETGHGIGLGHVCNCPPIMVPCLNCADTLAACDGQGAAFLYPPGVSDPVPPDRIFQGPRPFDLELNGAQMIIDWITVDGLKTMIDNSTLIVRGRVIEQRFEVERAYPYDPVLGRTKTAEEAGNNFGRLPFTYSTVVVAEVYKTDTGNLARNGQAPAHGTLIEVGQVGGEIDGRRVIPREDRLLQKGEELILFLSGAFRNDGIPLSGRYSTVGGFQGRFEIRDGRIMSATPDPEFAQYNGQSPAQFVEQIKALIK